MRFRDRHDAGRRLALALLPYRLESPLVLALPRGGVPVAYEIARALEAPLDLWIVKKIGAPGFEEYGIGAVAEGGHSYVDPASVRELGLAPAELELALQDANAEVKKRGERLRRGKPPPDVHGKTVILVDDGIATGGTVRVAIESLRSAGVHRIVLAAPVAPPASLDHLEPMVDVTVCLQAPSDLVAIGGYYDDFHQLSDAEVIETLERARGFSAAQHHDVRELDVRIPVEGGELKGILMRPPGVPLGLVLFAHGSGSSRLSPRNHEVAEELHRHGLATLLFDLLTEDEELVDDESEELRFDIPFLAGRLMTATDWLARSPDLAALPLGYFGASTGAAAALLASIERPQVRAVVSRGGRPDLAMDELPRVRAPTLLLVGSDDHEVHALNRRALECMRGQHELIVIPGASHLFEEPGTLEQVAHLAASWFARCLPAGAQPAQAAH